jgi:hypothetical protein
MAIFHAASCHFGGCLEGMPNGGDDWVFFVDIVGETGPCRSFKIRVEGKRSVVGACG